MVIRNRATGRERLVIVELFGFWTFFLPANDGLFSVLYIPLDTARSVVIVKYSSHELEDDRMKYDQDKVDEMTLALLYWSQRNDRKD